MSRSDHAATARFAPGDPEVFAAGLLGAIDVDGGPTAEQRAVLGAFVRHVWRLPDLDLDALTPLTPAEVAARLPEDLGRLRFCEMAMVLELCRHPQSPALVDHVERCTARLGVDGIEVETTRTALEGEPPSSPRTSSAPTGRSSPRSPSCSSATAT